MDMQKECKIRKVRELIKFFELSMTRSESAVPDSSKTWRYFGIRCSDSESSFAMTRWFSGVYKISTLFAIHNTASGTNSNVGGGQSNTAGNAFDSVVGNFDAVYVDSTPVH